MAPWSAILAGAPPFPPTPPHAASASLRTNPRPHPLFSCLGLHLTPAAISTTHRHVYVDTSLTARYASCRRLHLIGLWYIFVYMVSAATAQNVILRCQTPLFSCISVYIF